MDKATGYLIQEKSSFEKWFKSTKEQTLYLEKQRDLTAKNRMDTFIDESKARVDTLLNKDNWWYIYIQGKWTD